jgi:CRISPR-associated endonuclease/helicase Cas3
VTFGEFVVSATGGRVRPYPYQTALAELGLPEMLRAPTGSGKTLAAVLPWLYRRTAHPDQIVRAATPHWLVVVLPQRTLVEQTVESARAWVEALGAPVGVHVLMGGEDSGDREWKMHPDSERIFVGTQDMVLSRLLMRGFAEFRAAWPFSYGLLHAGVQFVFDEVQLMGPALPTSLQLQAFREGFGTALPCRSMWMSATIDAADLSTVDFNRALTLVDVTEGVGELARRMAATRTVGRLGIDTDARRYAVALAERVLAEHRPGTRTIVMLNTVERAMDVHTRLTRLSPDADLVLLHSRFRPADRATNTAAALAEPGAAGTIVVATQVIEAGVDVTSELLVTEVAPWPSIVQRAGRCNRDGRATNARLLWTTPAGAKTHLPYVATDLDAAAAGLTALEGRAMTGRELAERDVAVTPPIHPVLRRRDLLDLFDTTPDLAGDDIDVSAFIRDAEDRTVSVAWRDLDTEDMPAVHRSELCQAPIQDVREMITSDGARARIWDQVDGAWRPARRDDVRPGAIIVFDASSGGYLPERGFDPRSTQAVDPVPAEIGIPDAIDRDPLSTGSGTWVPLSDHLVQTETAARTLIERFGEDIDLSVSHRDAVVRAALLHDLGKAHPTFQASLVNANRDAPPPATGTLWAKSPGNRPLRHNPPHFRHELVTALWLAQATNLLDGEPEPDLVVYLAAAHHGKVRLTIRGLPDEAAGITLGVEEGSRTIGFALDGDVMQPVTLSLRPTTHGAGSLTSRALGLRDRADLGPFRLAFCEAMVRAADWQASSDGVG